MKNSGTEHAEFCDVSRLANAEVKNLQRVLVCGREEPVQERDDDARGMFAAENARGEPGNDQGNADCR